MPTPPPEHIEDNICACSICLSPSKLRPSQSTLEPGFKNENSLHKFLELFPKGFPLAVVSTAVPKSRTFYYNKFVRSA